jgi:3-oxoacyl-[acyl-carrier-protein] synthase-3
VKLPVGTRIIGVGAAVPPSVVTNADLETLVETSDEWIATRTGIRQRRIVKGGETCTDLAIAAAKDALAFAGIEDASIVDLVIVATSTPDNLYPSTACMVQAAVGASSAAAFDMEAACTGIVYALAVGHQFIALGTFRTVLVIGVDIHSRFLNWEDRNTCILFGDGAGAFVLQASETENDILATYLRADGKGAHLLWIPNTGSGYPHSGESAPKETHRFLQMNGRAIYEFAVHAVPEAVRAACTKAGLRVEDIEYLVPHQANKRIIKAAAERLGLKESQLISNLDQVGNTSAASIPLAFADAVAREQIKPPAICALVGFGGGLTWGSAIVRWNAVDKRLPLPDTSGSEATDSTAASVTTEPAGTTSNTTTAGT